MIEFQHNFSKEGLPSFDDSLSLAEVKNSQERSTLYGVPSSSQRSISKISFRLEQDSFSKAS